MEIIIVLKSYEAIYDHGAIEWLGDKPPVKQAHVIITILPEKESIATLSTPKKHQPSQLIAGKGKILDDIIKPVSPEEDWNCLK